MGPAEKGESGDYSFDELEECSGEARVPTPCPSLSLLSEDLERGERDTRAQGVEDGV